MQTSEMPSGRYYIHNGDYSGGLHTIAPRSDLLEAGDGTASVNIPAEDILTLAAQIVRERMGKFAESAPDWEILKTLVIFQYVAGKE